MADKELKLHKRKRATLINTIQKDVFAAIDGHKNDIANNDADAIAAEVTAD